MTWERSISGISSPDCTEAGCNPYTSANTALDELAELVGRSADDIRRTGSPGFNGEAVCKVVCAYKCEGPVVGSSIKMCGQLLTMSLFDRDDKGLLSGDFMSQVVLE